MTDHTVNHPRTGAERYFAKRMEDPVYAAGYRRARARIDAIDHIIRGVEEWRDAQGLSKAEVARRAKLSPALVRRVLTHEGGNPTLATVVAISEAVGLELTLAPAELTATKPSAVG